MRRSCNFGLKSRAALFIAVAATFFGGCVGDNPLGTQGTENAKLAQSSMGPRQLLSTNLDHASTFGGEKQSKHDSVFFVQKRIKANKGGELKVGNKHLGYSKIKFRKKDLPENLTISFQWTPSRTFEGLLNDAEFGPHGLIFNNPVKVQLSYKTANLDGVDESRLQVYYYREDSKVWELIGGKVDKKKKRVTAYLSHFSRYALAWSN